MQNLRLLVLSIYTIYINNVPIRNNDLFHLITTIKHISMKLSKIIFPICLKYKVIRIAFD